jgi:hypothetical protein
MKTTFIALFGAALLFTACGSNTEKAAEDTTQQETVEQDVQTAQVAYYCPMKCEGEKTYTENVGCPTCGMDLVQSGSDAPAEDSHEGHNHD